MAIPFVTVDKYCVYPPEVGLDLGAGGYRLTFDRTIPEQPDYLWDVISKGLLTFLVPDTDSFPYVDWAAVRENPWDDSLYRAAVESDIQDYARRYGTLCSYLQAGFNEWNDTGYEGSRMPAIVVNEITRIWRQYFPDHPNIVAASDISGDPESIAELDLAPCNLIDTHLWNKGPEGWPDEMSGRLGQTVTRYRDRWPWIRLCVSEYGYSSTENVPEGVDGEARQAEYVSQAGQELTSRNDLELAGLYAVQDWRGMGLIREDGTKKPSYWYYRLGSQYWSREPSPEPGPRPQPDPVDVWYEYVMSFADVNRRYPALLGLPLENEQGLVPGLVQQRTTEGELTFAQIKDVGDIVTFTRHADGWRAWWRKEDLSG